MLLKNRDGFDPKISLLQMIYINDDDRELFKEYIKKHQKEFEDKTVTIYQCVIQQKEWSPEMKEKLKRLDNMSKEKITIILQASICLIYHWQKIHAVCWKYINNIYK